MTSSSLHGAAGLDDRGGARLRDLVDAVAEREERVRGGDACRRAAAAPSAPRCAPSRRGSSGPRPRRPSAARSRRRSRSTSRACATVQASTQRASTPRRSACASVTTSHFATSRRCRSHSCASMPPITRRRSKPVTLWMRGRVHVHHAQVLLGGQRFLRLARRSRARSRPPRTPRPSLRAASPSTRRLKARMPPKAETGSHAQARSVCLERRRAAGRCRTGSCA